MRKIFILIFIASLFACNDKPKTDMSVKYPKTKTVDTVDVYFGVKVPDPYRWLEDDLSAETAEWVKAQNEVTFDYLHKLPYRNELKNRIEKQWNYAKEGAPRKHGDYYYFYKNDGLQNQAVMYRKKDLAAKEAEVFIDPNTFAKDGTVSLTGISFTKDGSLLAYQISEGGSDWGKIIVIKAENKELVGDTLRDIKFSGVSWKGNEGFYYSSYDKPKGKSQMSAKTQYHKLFFHKLGTPQSEDKLIFGGKKTARRYIGGGLTDDQKYLIISAANGTYGNELYVQDISSPNNEIKPISTGFDNEFSFVDNEGSRFLIQTDYKAPNNRLIEVDFNNLAKENWKDVIPESKNVMHISTAGGYLFASYMVDVKTEVYQYDYNGKQIRKVKLPAIGTAGGFGAEKEDTDLYYAFTSFTYPGTIFKYNIEKGTSELYWKPAIDFNPADYVTEQVFYESKDGTKIPMFIVYKKGLKKNGNNPTLLYAYGGFSISLRPSFRVSRLAWLEQGGIYAQPNLRGGGEYGEKWHKAGTKMQKQNVFDDFIAAAEYLKKEKYTSTKYLAISGGSNGGLLIGATITQRPDLAQVAFPQVGVLDMLRFHKFTSGAGWTSDYGNSDQSKEMFEYLKGYSPLHNVKDANYPATLIMTADHDDRVVPAHSFKFAAELQLHQKGNNPVLIRIETNAGHGAGTPTSKQIEQAADKYAFAFYNMGFKPKFN